MPANWIYNRLIPCILGILATAGIWIWCQSLEWPAYDLLARWTAQPVKDSPVVLVLIDDASIERLKPRFGLVPWPRKTYLEIFRAIQKHQPALMVFDGHFIDINEPGDAQFFQELKSFSNLLTGLAMHEAGHKEDNPLNTRIPYYYRLNLGVVSIRQDADGKIRRLNPVFNVRTGRYQSGIYPALSLSAATDYLNRKFPEQAWIMDIREQPPVVEIYPEARQENGIRLPLNRNQEFFLRWHQLFPQENAEYRRSHPAIPLWQLMNDKPNPLLKDKIALIGSSSTIYRDYHPSPLTQRHLGPDIHATAIDNILQSQVLQKAPAWQNVLILLMLSGLVFWMRLKSRMFGRIMFYTLGTMVIYFAAVLFLFRQGLWLDIVTPLVFMLLAVMAGSTSRLFFGEKQLARMEKNLSQLVSPDVFREIRNSGEILQPGGQKLDITSMFIDIRNFTPWAEHLAPGDVTALLNEFYTVMVEAVFEQRGTVDKFMGDGILVMFGAPIADAGHAESAFRAACRILDVADTLAARWREQYQLETDIGISLNSGPAFVGFLGPASKLEYTAVGDTVNLCVRLQEQTKQFRTRLVFSESTLAGLPEITGIRELGEVQVRGREAHLKIYTLEKALLKR